MIFYRILWDRYLVVGGEELGQRENTALYRKGKLLR